MPFDTTGLALALAEDRPAFDNHMGGTWPVSLYNLTGALTVHQDAKSAGTSGSSVTIGTGTKVFTLDVPKDWPNGLPVYIMESENPSTNVLVGNLSADADEGVITVNVTSAKGSGTFTSWVIISLFAVTTVVSTPVAIADGGTGGSTAALARDSLQVPKFFFIAGLANSAAVGSALISAHSSNSVYVQGADSDDFTGHIGEIATSADGGTSWSFVSLDEGVLVYSQEDELMYASNDSAEMDVLNKLPNCTSVPISTTTSVTYNPDADELIVWVSTATATITLPKSTRASYKIRFVYLSSGGTITVNVASGGTINGASSTTLTTQYQSKLFIQTPTVGSWVSV